MKFKIVTNKWIVNWTNSLKTFSEIFASFWFIWFFILKSSQLRRTPDNRDVNCTPKEQKFLYVELSNSLGVFINDVIMLRN